MYWKNNFLWTQKCLMEKSSTLDPSDPFERINRLFKIVTIRILQDLSLSQYVWVFHNKRFHILSPGQANVCQLVSKLNYISVVLVLSPYSVLWYLLQVKLIWMKKTMLFDCIYDELKEFYRTERPDTLRWVYDPLYPVVKSVYGSLMIVV